MRQRRTEQSAVDEPPRAVRKPIARRIANVDLFPKPKEDYQREQTKVGAMLSLATVALVVLLVLWESIAYLRGRDAYDTDVSLDMGLSEKMAVHFEVAFPFTTCNRLSIDIADATANVKFNCTGTIQKLPLNARGHIMYKGNVDELRSDVEGNARADKEKCRRCPASLFQDISEPQQNTVATRCCETCDSVLELFKEFSKDPPGYEYIPQCLERLYEEAQGCDVVGSLDLKKVPVTVVFGPRRTGSQYHMKDLIRLDTSHVIRKLRIGDETVERFSQHGVAEPLTGHKFMTKAYSETRYLLKVVPTTYRTSKEPNASASTYEYSAQWSTRAIAVGFGGGVPAVVFGFEPAAIQVNNVFVRQPVTHFLVKLCGIVGGLFVVLGFIDRAVEWCVALEKWQQR